MFTADQDLTFERLNIGGIGSIGGNGTGERVDIGGKFDVRGSLSLSGKLDVGGAVSVGGTLSAEQVEVGGKIDAGRAVVRGTVEIGGVISTRDGAKAARLRIRAKGRATGPLVGGRVEVESRARAEDIYGEHVELGHKASARRIYAATVRLEDGSEVDEVQYTQSIEMGSGTRCRTPPRKVDALPTFPL